MTIEINKLRYVGVYEEPDGSYQSDHSGSPGDFLAFPYQEGTLDAKGAVMPLDPNTGAMLLDNQDLIVHGPKSNTVNIGCVMHSHGLDLQGTEVPPTVDSWALFRVMKAIMGGQYAAGTEAAATTVQGGSTVDTINVTAGHGDRFEAGQAIGVQTVVGSSHLEVAEIASVSTDAIGLKQNLSAAPVAATNVRGAVGCYLTEDPRTSLQWLVEGREANDGVVYCGTQGGFAMQIPIGQLGLLSFALAGAGWDRKNASSVTIPSFDPFAPFALNPVLLTVPTVGSKTRRIIANSAITIEPGIAYAPQRSGAASETVARMRRQRVHPVAKLTFTAPLEDETWFDARDNRTAIAAFVQLGVLAGKIMFISLPTLQVVDVQPAPSETEISGQIVTCWARHDAALDDGTDEFLRSALRVSWL